jgi:hypothetical protein
MKIRLKDKYFRGCSASKKLLPEDIVLPGCEKYQERRDLKTKFDNKEITKDEYDEQRLAIINSMRRREGSPVITMEINHGDFVVMHGADMQKYYEVRSLRLASRGVYQADKIPALRHSREQTSLCLDIAIHQTRAGRAKGPSQGSVHAWSR